MTFEEGESDLSEKIVLKGKQVWYEQMEQRTLFSNF